MDAFSSLKLVGSTIPLLISLWTRKLEGENQFGCLGGGRATSVILTTGDSSKRWRRGGEPIAQSTKKGKTNEEEWNVRKKGGRSTGRRDIRDVNGLSIHLSMESTLRQQKSVSTLRENHSSVNG